MTTRTWSAEWQLTRRAHAETRSWTGFAIARIVSIALSLVVPLTGQVTERVSVDSSGAQGDAGSGRPSLSADGRYVAFASDATDLVAGDTNGRTDVFVHDRQSGVTERISVDSAGAQGNGPSGDPSISADGRHVAFHSDATDLVVGDTNGRTDVFVHDRETGVTERVSVDSGGAQGNGSCFEPSLAEHGRFVAFWGRADNLVPGDTNSSWDIFVHDRVTGITERISVDSSGVEANSWSFYPSSSVDGQVVAFSTGADNLVAGDTNGHSDVFVHERCDATWTNYGAGFPGTNGVPSFTSQADPVLGTTVTFDLANSYGNSAVGLILVGYQETLVPTSKGGDLLVVPAFTILFMLAMNGASMDCDFPPDESLCGVESFAQALELDPGAAKGMSFTAGLKLVLGH